VNSTLTEAADKQSTSTDRPTPRALRYVRRSGGLVEPSNQPDKKASSITARSSTALQNTHTASKTTDVHSRKRSSTEPTTSEAPSKRVKKESRKLTLSSNTNSSYKAKQESVLKKQATAKRLAKSTVVGKQTHRRAAQKTSNLERGKEKAAKGDKVSTKATAGQPSTSATASAGQIPTKKHLQRASATAAASAETSSNTAADKTATACTSHSSRAVTRRAATKRGGALLTSSSHLTDTTGTCASSK